MSDLYNIKEAGEDSPKGPYSLEQLQEIAKQGDMTPDTLITLEGSKGWIPINQIPAVKSALFPQKPKLKLIPAKDKPTPPPPPPPPSQKSRPDKPKQPVPTPPASESTENQPSSPTGEAPPPAPQVPEAPPEPEIAPDSPPPTRPVADNTPPPPPPPPQAPAPDFKREAMSLWGIGLTIGGLVAWIIGFSVPVLVFLGVFALVYSIGIFMLAKFFSR